MARRSGAMGQRAPPAAPACVRIPIPAGVPRTLLGELLRRQQVMFPPPPLPPRPVRAAAHTCIQAPADGEGTKHPRVARALRMRLRVLNAGIAALLRDGKRASWRRRAGWGAGIRAALRRWGVALFAGRRAEGRAFNRGIRLWLEKPARALASVCRHLRRGLAVVDAEDDRHSASVGMGLFHALRRGRHARAVGEAAGDLSSRGGACMQPVGRRQVRVLACGG